MKISAALLLAAPVLLLAAACSSSDSGDTKHASEHAATAVASGVSSSPAIVPTSTPTTADPALKLRRERDKIQAEVDQDLKKAHLPDGRDKYANNGDCNVTRTFLAPMSSYHRTRESMVALLREQKWQSAISSGTDETHLTRNGWDMFVSRITDIKGDGGVTYQQLTVSATCP
ncbi:hypothetical protein [Streptomyces sp. CA-111067]|uniref:hypothetical protein n=1 Tax=Streptomyces sp. CA-111067 TaxID=3240046 RepID=UPI003D9685B1